MIRFFAACFVMLALSAAAHARCPWSGPVDSASATMTLVLINGQTFSVKGSGARTAFISTLSECGVNGLAVSHFSKWRGYRRATNWTAGVGLLCLWPALLATPVTAVLAGTEQDAMISALLTR